MSDAKENNAVFSGTNYAENYRKGRPKYPTSLIDSIISFLKEKVSNQQMPKILCIRIYFNAQMTCEFKVNIDIF